MGGLQLPYLGQTCSFSIVIQILHNGADHWLVASNIGLCETNQVQIYDSMYRWQLTTTTQLQIAAIMKTSAPHITVEFVEVQRQNGSDDRGVYAIAFAVALSLSKDPGTLTFAESDIRKHLFNMLNKKKL